MSGRLDALVLEWGEQLYYRPVQSRPVKKSTSGLLLAVAILSKASVRTRVDRVRKITALTVRKAPEVMVKISGSSKGMKKIKAHFDYISRNGKVELENESGDSINGRDSVRDLCSEWKNGQYGIPDEGTKREAFNIVLSMPPGTNRAAVTRAAREFARSEFSENHQFVFATHDDERHPHLHLCVKTLGFDGTRLNPRKPDLQRWREGFAEHLREHGTEANATPRIARGVSKSASRQQDLHRLKRDPSHNDTPPAKPAYVRAVLRKSIGAYKGLAQVFAESVGSQDRQLAIGIIKFVRDLPEINKTLFEDAKLEQQQTPATSTRTRTRPDRPGPERE